ncbi:MAG: plasmid stabilization protein [Acidimicrobiales bacterium]|nr:plasmid stabilization protein [Acidimicrobiales bacterium]
MATLTIRNLDDKVRDRLRVQAAENGRSMEAEAREILSAAIGERRSFGQALLDEFKDIGIEGGIPLPPRSMPRDISHLFDQ